MTVTTWSHGTEKPVNQIVNVEKTGTYMITYRAHDLGSGSNWNDNGPVRTVIVIDSLKPVIGVFDNKHLISMSDGSDLGHGGVANPASNGPPVPASGFVPGLDNDPVMGHIVHEHYWTSASAGLMAEASSVTSNVAWGFGAFGSAVMGIGLLVRARIQPEVFVPV